MFRRLVARVAVGIGDAEAVAAPETLLQLRVDAVVARVTRHVAPLDVAEIRIRQRTVGIERTG
jgi:hypothetical protein